MAFPPLKFPTAVSSCTLLISLVILITGFLCYPLLLFSASDGPLSLPPSPSQIEPRHIDISETSGIYRVDHKSCYKTSPDWPIALRTFRQSKLNGPLSYQVTPTPDYPSGISKRALIPQNSVKDYKSCNVTAILTSQFVAKHGPTKREAILAVQHLFSVANERVFHRTFFGADPKWAYLDNQLQRVIFDDAGLFDSSKDKWTMSELQLLMRYNLSKHYPTDSCLVYVFDTRPIFTKNEVRLDGFSKHASICKPGRNFGFISTSNCPSVWDTDSCPTGRYILPHEFAHSYGAHHEEQDPSVGKAGSHLMVETDVALPGPNNEIISDNSLSEIVMTISTIAPQCFTEPKDVCGNWLLEVNEQCDNGPKGSRCCTPKCKLVPEAECSPDSHKKCSTDCKWIVESVATSVPTLSVKQFATLSKPNLTQIPTSTMPADTLIQERDIEQNAFYNQIVDSILKFYSWIGQIYLVYLYYLWFSFFCVVILICIIGFLLIWNFYRRDKIRRKKENLLISVVATQPPLPPPEGVDENNPESGEEDKLLLKISKLNSHLIERETRPRDGF